MTALAPLLEAFFLDGLLKQRQASPNTIAAYRDTFRLLLVFAEKRLSKAPSSSAATASSGWLRAMQRPRARPVRP